MLNRPQLYGCNRLRIAAPALRLFVLQSRTIECTASPESALHWLFC
jgi:hypothetical protein